VSSSIISHAINASHAGITAEGDNAVLFTKVVNELLSLFIQGSHSELWTPRTNLQIDAKQIDINNIDHLDWLISHLIKSLAEHVMNSMASTGDKKKSLAMWKFELSNEVQDLALLVGLKLMVSSTMNHLPVDVKDRDTVQLCLLISVQE